MSLKYKIVGDGSENIIVMHEWIGDCTNYDTIVPFIDRKNFRWIFIDFRGYGKSKEFKGEYNLDEMCSDVKSVIKELKIDSFSLLGHSMSSLVAQRIAVDLDFLIKKLILITPILPTGIKMNDISKNKMLERVKNRDGLIEEVVESASKRYNQNWKDYRIELAHNCSTIEAKVGYMNMYLSNDITELVKDINVSVRIIVGKYDLPAFHKNSIARQMSKYYSDLEIVECNEAGHYPMIECPVFFVNQVEKFIRT